MTIGEVTQILGQTHEGHLDPLQFWKCMLIFIPMRRSALPKAGMPGHVAQLRSALDLPLTPQHMTALDRAFPPPKWKVPLK